MIEAFVIATLFVVGYVIFRLYKSEIDKNKDKFEEAIQYIGGLNIQLDSLKSLLNDVRKYPENKTDFRNILILMADKILSIVNCEWVVLRLIDAKTLQTLSEHSGSRGSAILLKYSISNKNIIEGKQIEDCTILVSTKDNVDVQTCVILSINGISDEQQILINTIINNIGMLYIIFSSTFYKNKKR